MDSALEAQVRAKLDGLPKRVVNKIIKEIKNDCILAQLQLPSHPNIDVSMNDEIIWVTIDARDFDFSRKGEWIGSGTMLRKAKWKC